ncbi:hypothetical protein ACFV4S_36875, partial [Streptomyces sp. NPDC059742]
MSITATRVAPSTLRTTTGREATRWVTAHCREVPWLTFATVFTTVAGAALQVLPLLLLGRVVDGVVAGGPRSILVTTGVLLVGGRRRGGGGAAPGRAREWARPARRGAPGGGGGR